MKLLEDVVLEEELSMVRQDASIEQAVTEGQVQ